MMRRFLTIAMLGVSVGAWGAGAWAAGADDDLMHAGENVHDMASVQRGAALFVNYCSSCHSAEYMRYLRLAEDLGLSERDVEENLIFGTREITDLMIPAMDPDQAEAWFGAPPPDVTLTARARGADWVYTFLNSFYLTENGWNNRIFSFPAMPHVLWELQGIQRPVTETYVDQYGDERTRVVDLELEAPGLMSESEYRRATRDLTAFMVYMAEPAILKREPMGIWVVLFLGLLCLLTYLLYKEYWKDVRK